MKKFNTPITSSISGYFLILSILNYIAFGTSNTLWIMIIIFLISFAWSAYSTYKNSNTVFGISIDNGVMGGLLITYFYPLINIEQVAISSYIAFIVGIYLLLKYLMKKIFN